MSWITLKLKNASNNFTNIFQVFEIPITVVRPEPLIMEPRPHIEHKNVGFIPGDIKRHFIKTPMDATWAVVRVRSEEKNVTGKKLNFNHRGHP